MTSGSFRFHFTRRTPGFASPLAQADARMKPPGHDAYHFAHVVKQKPRGQRRTASGTALVTAVMAGTPAKS